VKFVFRGRDANLERQLHLFFYLCWWLLAFLLAGVLIPPNPRDLFAAWHRRRSFCVLTIRLELHLNNNSGRNKCQRLLGMKKTQGRKAHGAGSATFFSSHHGQ
jgi:hypothetical protein